MDKFAFVMECGFLKPAATVATSDIPDIVRAVYLEYIVLLSSQEVAQFIEGLQTIGIATLIKRHPLVLKKLCLRWHAKSYSTVFVGVTCSYFVTTRS